MNDAEFLRKEAHGWREEARERASHGDHDLQEEATQRADRLTALAAELDGGVIVPREPTGAMRIAGISEYEDMTDDRLPDGDGFDEEIISAIYRAMLTASEAK